MDSVLNNPYVLGGGLLLLIIVVMFLLTRNSDSKSKFDSMYYGEDDGEDDKDVPGTYNPADYSNL